MSLTMNFRRPLAGDRLDQALRDARAEKDAARPEQRTHLYASEVGTVAGEAACHRKLWMAFHDTPKDPLPPDTLLAFEIGDAVGWRIANILAKRGVVEKVELPMAFPGYPVTGRLDILLSRDRTIVEVKTATQKQRKYLPKVDHIAQCNLYLHGVQQLREYEDVTSGEVLYVFKDAAKGQPIQQSYAVPYDKTLAQETLKAFGAAFDVARGEDMPDRPEGFSPSKFPCSYCAFQTACWSGWNPSTEVPF